MTRDVSRLYGIDPNYTLGMDAGRYLEHARGECHAEEPCALCLLERAEAALARVERLCDETTMYGYGEHGLVDAVPVSDIRAALRGDRP